MAEQTKSVSRSIYLDTQAAENNMQKLVAKGDLLKKKINEGEAAGKSMIKEFAKLQQVDKDIQKVQDQLDKGLKPTLQQQTNLVRQLRNELSRMSENDPAFVAKKAIFDKQNETLATMNSRLKGVQENGGKLTNVFTKIGGAIAGLFVIDKVAGFFSSAINEAEQAEESFHRLKNTLENIGRTDALDRLTAKAEEMAKRFKYLDNDDVIAVFDKLITYGNLTENQINDLTPVIINFAAKQRITIEESSSVVIKALEGNSKALKEYGINMKEGSSVTERFGILMSDLKVRVDGAGESFAETFKGKLAIARQELKDTQEQIGNDLIPVLSTLTGWLSKALKGLSEYYSLIKKTFETGNSTSAIMSMVTGDIANDIIAQNNRTARDLLNAVQGKSVVEKKIYLQKLEGQIIKLEAQHATAKASGDIDFQQRLGNQIPAYKIAIKKLAEEISPEMNKVLGAGGKDLDKEAADKLEALRQKFEEMMGRVRISSASALSPLEGEFARINEEIKKELALIAEVEKAGAISAKTAKEAIKTVEQAAQAQIDAALEKADREELVKRKKRLESIYEALALAKKAFAEQGEGVGPKSALPNIAEKSYDYYNKDRLAGAELAVVTSKSAQARLAALNKQLDLEEQLELRTGEKTENEKLLIIEKYAAKRSEMAIQVANDNFKEIISFARQGVDILSSISNIATTNENRQLQLQLRNNDIAKQSIQRQLQNKILTTQEAASRLAAIDVDSDKRKKALEQEQFKRNQKIQTAQALINGAMGVTAALAAMPGAADIISLGAFRALQIGFTIATTAAQVAVINSQKPAFGKGGYLTGPSHAAGGMPVINPRTGNVEAEVEGDEVILSKNTVKNNRSLVSALLHSSMNRNGTTISPFWENRSYQSLNYAGITGSYKKFDKGGVFPGGSSSSSGDEQSSAAIMGFTNVLQRLNDRLDQPFTGYITQSQMEDSNTQKAKILSAAKIG